ncbi:hypothetical protein ACKFKG_11310 [Phormidesmis sp. 146-35]
MTQIHVRLNRKARVCIGAIATLAFTTLGFSPDGMDSQASSVSMPLSSISHVLPRQQRPVLMAQSQPRSVPSAIRAAILKDVSQRLETPIQRLEVVRSTRFTFGNWCQFNFSEICTTEFDPVPGWKVVVKVRDQDWTYHGSRSGSLLILDPKIAVRADLSEAIRDAVLKDAATWSQTDAANLQVVDTRKTTWGNTCEFSFGQICPAIYQPVSGWEVSLQNSPARWTYRVSDDAKTVILDRRAALPSDVVQGIVQDIVRQNPAIVPESLRFIVVRRSATPTAPPTWLTVVSNGRRQWGYRATEQQVRPVPVKTVLLAGKS